VQCDRREVGLAWGEYCTVCRAERERRANRVAQRVGIVGAVLLAAYLIWRSPNQLTPRIFAAASVVLVYVVLRRIVSRVVLDLMPGKQARRERGEGSGKE
jgi:hypothetical protein